LNKYVQLIIVLSVFLLVGDAFAQYEYIERIISYDSEIMHSHSMKISNE